MKKASKIIVSNVIYPGKGCSVMEGAIIIIDNRVEAIVTIEESENWIDSKTIIYEYHNQLVMPSFVDAHVHLTFASIAIDEGLSIQLSHCQSEQECAKEVQKFASKHIESSWIFGFGWCHLTWENQKLPSHISLDELNIEQAVSLVSDDFHSIWLNKKAMELCGIDDFKDEYSQSIVRFSDKCYTGVLLDNAALYALDLSIEAAGVDIKSLYKNLFNYVGKYGVTTIGDVAPTGIDKEYEVLKELEDEGSLRTRIRFYADMDKYMNRIDNMKDTYKSPMLSFGGFKAFVDGVTSVHTAHLLEPYNDRPDLDGRAQVDYKKIRQQVELAYKYELPIRLHVIGDAAVRNSLDILEEANNKFGKPNYVNTLEHIEVIHPEDIKRFSELSVIPSMQPLHGTDDIIGFTKSLGELRAKSSWAFRSFLRNEARLAFGTDFPIADINPLRTIYAAVSRKNENDIPKGSWNPEERISVQEAIDAYTYGAAEAIGLEKVIGTLEPGKYADIVVLDKDIINCEEDEILDTKVLMTILNGEVVYKQ